ncbi:hypothetical protein ACFO9E_18070 [Streptomyces maoxianensis]|uniref:DUF1918 domain-containing protein n=1 Tax=Streptomyces maoxianensis TaxID=1459942 RepID=A0ABV9G635_9ACTN
MNQQGPWVGDQVHDEDTGRDGIVTDVRGGRYVLRPLYGMDEWENENAERLTVTVPRSEEKRP